MSTTKRAEFDDKDVGGTPKRSATEKRIAFDDTEIIFDINAMSATEMLPRVEELQQKLDAAQQVVAAVLREVRSKYGDIYQCNHCSTRLVYQTAYVSRNGHTRVCRGCYYKHHEGKQFYSHEGTMYCFVKFMDMDGAREVRIDLDKLPTGAELHALIKKRFAAPRDPTIVRYGTQITETDVLDISGGGYLGEFVATLNPEVKSE